MPCSQHKIAPQQARRGLTLPELLIASSIVALMLAALGTLASAVDSGHEYSHGRGVATQHARVAMERITRNLNGAYANSEFPGFVVFREVSGTHSFPDLIVIWNPEGAPANPTGLPLASELVAYCPNPNNPAELWEITAPSDTRTVPALSDSSGWATVVALIKEAEGPERVVITDLLRTATVGEDSGTTITRGAVRFEVTLRPTAAELQAYADGTTAWDELPWVQGIYSNTMGLRQAWCSVELQLMPSNWSAVEDPRALSTIPFFASGAVYYEVTP